MNFDDIAASDSLTLQQFNDGRRRGDSEYTPHRRLMVAVLEGALNDYQRYVHSQSLEGKRIFWQAVEWIREPGRDSPFGFDLLCEELGIDPAALRHVVISGNLGKIQRHSTAGQRALGTITPLRRRSHGRRG